MTLTAAEKQSVFSKLLPTWVTANATSWQSWRVVIRCWIAIWCAFILILPHNSLSVMGNAAFFAAFSLYIIPPMLPVQMYFFAASTLLLGCLTGWAWGCAAMAAAYKARNVNVLRAEYQREESSLSGQSNPDQLFQIDIFHGVFLDPGSSAVFGAFLATGTFFFAFVRVKAPRLALFSVFGTVFLDVICSYGVLFPATEYLILSTFLISAPVGVAIGLVTTILIFPRTLSYEYMETMSKAATDIQHIISFQKAILSVDPEESTDAWGQVEAEVIGRRAKMGASLADLQGKSAMLDLEVSRARYSATDLKDLIPPLQRVAASATGLAIFTEVIRNWRQDIIQYQKGSDASASDPPTNGTSTPKEDEAQAGSGSRTIHGSSRVHAYLTRSLSLEESQGHQFHTIMPLLGAASSPLIDACADALSGLSDVINAQNASRWHRRASNSTDPLEEEQSSRISRLKETLAQFRDVGRLNVLGPYEGVMGMSIEMPKSGTFDDLPFSLRPLYFAFTFQSSLISLARNEIALLEAFEGLQLKRKHNRFWAPTGLRKLAHLAVTGGSPVGLGDPILDKTSDASSDSLTDTTSSNTTTSDSKEKSSAPTKSSPSSKPTQIKTEHHDPDAGPASNPLQKFARVLSGFYHWSLTAEGLFCWKYAIVGVCVWMPMTFRHSAYFTYVNRGLWALIMAHTGLGVYVADQMANYAFRLAGTFIGLLLGMVIWYIGDGHGNGNPYTLALVLAFVMLPLQFMRVHAPPQQLAFFLMIGITALLIVGYSWIDTHLPTLSNPGVGWGVAWRRWVLVIVGMAAAFIIMLIPPKSSRQMVRRANGTTLKEICDFYDLLVEGWIEAEGIDYRQLTPDSPGKAKLDKIKARFLKVQGRLTALKGQTALGKFEFNFRGAWPQKEYAALVDCQVHMLDALYQLSGVLFNLDPAWRNRVAHRTIFLDPSLVHEINSIFFILSNCLTTASPVTATLPPNLMDRLFMYHSVPPGPHDHDRNGDAGLGLEQPKVWGDVLKDEQLAIFAASRVALNYFVQQLDQAQGIVRRLCGEVRLVGFEEFRALHDEREKEFEARRGEHSRV